MAALLSAALQEDPAALQPKPGEEVRSEAGAEGDDDSKPPGEGTGPTADEETAAAQELERLTAKAEAEGKTVEEVQAEEAAAAGDQKSEDGDQPELPEHLEAELKQWEEQGGPLPASLQTMFNKRVGKAIKERDDAKAEAEAARTELEAAQAELEQARTNGKAPVNLTGGLTPETLEQSVQVAKRLVADVRALAGDYATDEQRARLDGYAKKLGLDEAGLKRSADEWSEWLRDDVPQLRQGITQFKAAEREVAQLTGGRFASLKKKDAPEAAWAKEVRELVPELAQRTPAHELSIGVYVLGKLAWDHLSKASETGDVIEALRGVLTKHVPLPVAKPANGKPVPRIAGALPGKAPVKSPITGAPTPRPRTTGREAEQEVLSKKLKENPTGENAVAMLASALR